MKNLSIKREAKRRLLTVLLAIVVLLTMLACGGTTAPRSVAFYTVEYRVTGRDDGSADVCYRNADGGTEMHFAAFPWSKTIIVPEGAFAYISAQNNWNYGWVKASIYVDSKLWKTAESQGAYVIARSSGRVVPPFTR